MDYIFIIFILILIILLILTYLLVYVKKTKNLNEIFDLIRQREPQAISFTVAYSKKRKMYKNYYSTIPDEKNPSKFTLKWEKQPVGLFGKLVFLDKLHGTIVNDLNGYKILGLNGNKTLLCPNNFFGPNCIMKPICSSNDYDNENIKRLNQSQFNALNLYNSNFIGAENNTNNLHPRIRVQCLSNRTYNLLLCEPNKLLNEHNECEEYDICEEKLDGFRHNMPISRNTIITDNEYFVCLNNKSEKRKCPDNMVFNAKNITCITRTICSGENQNKRIYKDKDHYIQCKDGLANIVTCSYGVTMNDETGEPECKRQKCQTKYIETVTEFLRYYGGAYVCDRNDKSTMIKCKDEFVEKQIGDTFKFGSDELSIKIKQWPVEIFDLKRKTCTTEINDKDIIRDDATITLAWTKNMSDSYAFNLKSMKYVCQKDEKYCALYNLGVIEPEPDDHNIFIDTAKPCQKDGIPYNTTLWFKLNSQLNFQLPTLGLPIAFCAYIGNASKKYNTWPSYDKNKKLYTSYEFIRIEGSNRESEKSNKFNIIKHVDSTPPLGFQYDEKNKLVLPIGYTTILNDFKEYTKNLNVAPKSTQMKDTFKNDNDDKNITTDDSAANTTNQKPDSSTGNTATDNNEKSKSLKKKFKLDKNNYMWYFMFSGVFSPLKYTINEKIEKINNITINV